MLKLEFVRLENVDKGHIYISYVQREYFNVFTHDLTLCFVETKTVRCNISSMFL